MAAQTRIYMVAIGEKTRLVRATHPSHALTHVARDIAKVTVASQDDLVRIVMAGGTVERIANEQSELPTT